MMEHSKRVELPEICRNADAISRFDSGRQYAVFLQGWRRVTKVIYPGSFDPLTFGHIDIIERSRAPLRSGGRGDYHESREAAAVHGGGAARDAATRS